MIKQLFSKHPQAMRRLTVANLLAIIGFFLLYLPFSPRPYSNLAYFFLMLVGGIYLSKQTGFCFFKKSRAAFFSTLTGIGLMLLIYAGMRYSFVLVSQNEHLRDLVDTNQWRFFVKPWVEMNLFLSVSGVIMIVAALEVFYRAYIQEFFSRELTVREAILLTSLLSGIRGWGGGSMAGPIDFGLALIWGWVYHHGGLGPAFIVHLCWDIPFVYFAP